MNNYLFIIFFSLLFIGIIEFFALHLFLKVAFKTGIPVFKKSIDVKTSKFDIKNRTVYKAEGKFHFSNNKVYFLSQIFLGKPTRIKTLFPLIATGTLNQNNTIDIIVKIPLISMLFTLYVVIFEYAFSVTIDIQNENISSGNLKVIAWIVIGLIILTSYFIQKKRIDYMISELKQIIKGYS